MKKNGSKKLQLSRETLQALASADVRKAAGGASIGVSCPSGCGDGGFCMTTIGGSGESSLGTG